MKRKRNDSSGGEKLKRRIEVNPEWTIGDLKSHCAKEYEVEKRIQLLFIHNSARLDDSVALKDLTHPLSLMMVQKNHIESPYIHNENIKLESHPKSRNSSTASCRKIVKEIDAITDSAPEVEIQSFTTATTGSLK